MNRPASAYRSPGLRWAPRKRARGQILVIVAVAMVVLLGLVGSGVDYGIVLMEDARMQHAVDAAALAAAKAVIVGPSPGIPAAQATATEYLRLHGYQNGVNHTTVAFAAVTPSPAGPPEHLTVGVTRQQPTYFWRVLGFNQVALARQAQARPGGGEFDVVVSVDESYSMSRRDMEQLSDALTDLLNLLNPNASASRSHRLAIAQFQGQVCPSYDGVWAWGKDDVGQVGNGSASSLPVRSPESIPPFGIAAASAGWNHSLSALGSGTNRLRAWGENGGGQVGDGTTTDRNVPTTVSLSGRIGRISAGGEHSMALLTTGTYRIRTWGGNSSGQLGNGSTTNSSTPVTVTLSEVQRIAAGGYHSMALRSTGTNRVYTWGDNSSAQLGDGTRARRTTPVNVTLSEVTDIAAGGYHSMARATGANRVYTWGENSSGQLGDGTTLDRSTPVNVILSGVIGIAAGERHSLALRGDGTVWAWGENASGQLGDGTRADRAAPIQVRGPEGVGFLDDIEAIAAGGRHSLALHFDGTIWAWGENIWGQLGDGTAVPSTTPVQVSQVTGLTDGLAISAGGSHSMAIARAPCVRDAHVLTELTTDRAKLLKIINGPSAGCPALPAQPPNTTPPDPPATYGCPLDDVGGSGTYIKMGFEVAFIPGQWNLWSEAKGGRADAKDFLILVTDGRNETRGVDEAAANTLTVQAADRVKRGPDGVIGTDDDIVVLVVGFFGEEESGLAETFPPPCPSDTLPAGRSAVDDMLISASSSTPGTCDHYYPLTKDQSLPAVFRVIAGRILRGALTD